MLRDLMNSWKAFSTSLLVVKAFSFSLQKVVKMLEEAVVSWLLGSMADETKLYSPIHSTWSTGCVTWGRMLSWRRTGTFLLTSASCRHCSFWSISLSCWAHFSDVMVSLGFRKVYSIRLAADHQWPWSFLGCKFGFGKCFGASSRSNHWVSCCRLSHKIHFLSHVIIQLRNGSLLLHRIREAETLKWRFFFFDSRSAHEAPTYQAFSPFQSALNAKWP